MPKGTLIVPGASNALDQMKYEIANELGINLTQGYNGNLTSREVGLIGGNITKRLVQIAEQSLGNRR